MKEQEVAPCSNKERPSLQEALTAGGLVSKELVCVQEQVTGIGTTMVQIHNGTLLGWKGKIRKFATMDECQVSC